MLRLTRRLEQFWFEGDVREKLQFLRRCWCALGLFDLITHHLIDYSLIMGGPYRRVFNFPVWDVFRYVQSDFLRISVLVLYGMTLVFAFLTPKTKWTLLIALYFCFSLQTASMDVGFSFYGLFRLM